MDKLYYSCKLKSKRYCLEKKKLQKSKKNKKNKDIYIYVCVYNLLHAFTLLQDERFIIISLGVTSQKTSLRYYHDFVVIVSCPQSTDSRNPVLSLKFPQRRCYFSFASARINYYNNIMVILIAKVRTTFSYWFLYC